jgi:DNA repair protein RadD
MPKKWSVLVFACSVEHAEILTLALNYKGRTARCITGDTPRHERLTVLAAFRNKQVNFVCSVGVLTMGFDAPQINAVCITRPTTSALLYEQMVGRGLRGPRNGGTASCRILDVQDQGLPQEIMSYGRVVKIWDGKASN